MVVKTTLDGEEVFTLGYPKESEFYKPGADGKPATKYSPTNLAIAPNGDIYVGDGYGSSYINQYNSKGEFIRTFGGKGKEPASWIARTASAVDLRGPQPLLMVADRANARLQYFTLDGKHIELRRRRQPAVLFQRAARRICDPGPGRARDPDRPREQGD